MLSGIKELRKLRVLCLVPNPMKFRFYMVVKIHGQGHIDAYDAMYCLGLFFFFLFFFFL